MGWDIAMVGGIGEGLREAVLGLYPSLVPRFSEHVQRRRRGEPGISRVRMRKFYPDFG